MLTDLINKILSFGDTQHFAYTLKCQNPDFIIRKGV